MPFQEQPGVFAIVVEMEGRDRGANEGNRKQAQSEAETEANSVCFPQRLGRSASWLGTQTAWRKNQRPSPPSRSIRIPLASVSHAARARRTAIASKTSGIRGRTGAFAGGCERTGFRLVHFSVQSNHVHLIAEGDCRTSLTRGLQGLAIRMAR